MSQEPPEVQAATDPSDDRAVGGPTPGDPGPAPAGPDPSAGSASDTAPLDAETARLQDDLVELSGVHERLAARLSAADS